MEMESLPWGRVPEGLPDAGTQLTRYEARTPQGLTAAWCNWGASLVSVKVPDRQGRSEEVVLSFLSGEDLVTDGALFGGTVGRWANRIAGGRFFLGGKAVQLSLNLPPHHIHGGHRSLARRPWTARPFSDHERAGVLFTLEDEAGNEGYPGTLRVEAEYWLSVQGELGWEYRGTSDAPTIVNLVNHTYWNLGGAACTSVLDHRLTLRSRFYYPAQEDHLPAPGFLPVGGTPFDFQDPHPLGERLPGEGYDHCYILEKKPGAETLVAARLEDPVSGRSMEMETTAPCLQLYTGNHLGGALGTGGRVYTPHTGVCLENQLMPDSPNRFTLPPGHPSPVILPGNPWVQRTVHRFNRSPSESLFPW